MTPAGRRAYDTYSIYQACDKAAGCPPMVDGVRPDHNCRGRWRGAIEAGWNSNGTRRRVTASGKSEAIVKRRLRDKALAIERGEEVAGRVTVKAWAATYLAMRVRDLSPKGYGAASSPIHKWAIPTIGHRRLDQLTPADVRAVADAQRRAGLKATTAAATQRALMTMLRGAVDEGHTVPERVLRVKAPPVAKSDRLGMTIEEGLRCLEVASRLPHGTRWLVTLLYGMRQGECLGLTWEAVDFEAEEIRVEWQLQAFPWLDRTDKRRGFRVPDNLEARHLIDAWHLKRPKTQQGYRIAPMLPQVRDGLLRWRELAPENPWGLVWPTTTGRPANNKHDLTEWWAVQGTAEVGHPSGRYYHVHECRNFAATILGELGVDPFVIRTLLGHADVKTSEGYRNQPRGPLREAMQRVGERLALG